MPPGNGNGNGGGGSLEILGLDSISDDGTPDDDITSLQTNFVIEGTIDSSILTDPNFDSLTIVINGIEFDVTNYDTTTGDWTYTYTGAAIDPGTVTVDAYYTRAHPKNGKLQDKPAINTYTFEIDTGGGNNPATISGENSGNVTEDSATPASGLLTVNDPDPGENQLQPLNQSGDQGHGTFNVLADGNWTYTLDNTDPAVQALAAGANLQDTITVTSADGSDTEVITVTITGVNDPASISGPNSGTVTEDGTQTASGLVTVSDVDTGENIVATVAPGAATVSGYGTYELQVDGTWIYTLNNGHAAVQALGTGESLTDEFTVLSADGTGSHLVTITINGADEPNNPATISGQNTGNVTEDSATPASGLLTVTDPDTGEDELLPLNQAGDLGFGTFDIQADGNWTYTLNNALNAVQALGIGDTLADTITVTSADGTDTEVITVTINGANDTASMSGDDSGTVTEDGTQTASGSVGVTDVDAGEDVVQPVSAGAASDIGYGTYEVQANGTWVYTLDNSHGAVQALGAGESLIDTFDVISDDGSGVHTVTITINGADEANSPATISGQNSGNVTEDGTTLTSGLLTVSDPDPGENQLLPQNEAGDNGYGTFNVQADGNWTFTLNNAHAAVQALAAGAVLQDMITVTSADGSDTEVITVTITGTNDVPTITGPLTGDVTEDGAGSAGGTLSVNDVDSGESSLAPTSGGSYGTFNVLADGNWTYNLNHAHAAVQALGIGGELTDQITVDSFDGTASQTIVVTIHGSNDNAVITGSTAGGVTEDGAGTDTGNLVATDPDTGESGFQSQSNTAGLYGDFSISGTGSWAYNLNHASVQFLGEGQTATDSFLVASVDGTTETVEITVTGTNDGASISGSATGDVTEDTALSTGGSLSVNDADSGEAALIPATGGTYGTFDVQADGTWTYNLNTGLAAVQALGLGDSLTDQITVDSVDGTASETIVVTINGSNDGALITGDTTGGVTEDGTGSAIGVLNAVDPDAGEDGFQVQTGTAGLYGTFNIDVSGAWDYSLNHASVQSLGQGQTVIDSFMVTSADGSTTETVEITVTGTNDGASISGDTTDAVTEDGALIATGVLTVTDPDAGESLALAVIAGTASDGGYGTCEVLDDGTWTYTLDNNHPAVQALAAGAFLIDTFTVDSFDGSASQVVTVTINGADEPPPPPPPPPPGSSYTPDDPLYSAQWHLGMIGDIERIWSEFDGSGISVGVYDNGVEYTHPDLAGNYDPTKHVTVGGSVLDPAPSAIVTAEHGTAVSGVIAGVDNDEGGVGVAFGASLTGINIFGGPADINAHLTGGTVDGFAEAMGQANTFDIINNSWGAAPDFNNETDASILAALAAFQTAVQTGRGLLGTIIVKASGNDWDNAQGDYLNTSRYTITVAAHDEDGDASWYTNRGANVLVSAPSSGSSADNDRGITTTDETDSEGNVNDDQGYSDGNYTDTFGGTSSATPMVSGVIALMLEANAGLGWRDVQSILAYSAHHLSGDPGETAPVPEGGGGTVAFPVDFFDWVETDTNNWNGGGQTFSEDYGFGGVNAYNSVRMAEVWHLFDTAQTSANEISYQGALQSPGLRFSLDPVSASFSISQAEANAIGMQLEYVEVFVSFSTAHTFSALGDISVNLISASGTELSLIQAVKPSGTPDDWTETNDFLPFGGGLGGSFTWTFGITALRDEDLAGDWSIEIYDVDAELSPDWTGGTLHDIQFTFYGATANNDDVYHYTDEVFGLLAADPTRLTLSDGAGNDWVNMAALAGDLTVSLATDGTGGALDAALGTFMSIAPGTQIENAVTGDGNDTVTGNDAANEIGGMRGNDILWGLGDDDVFWFFQGSGQDWVGDFADGVGPEQDQIGLYGFGFASTGDFSISQAGADALIDLGGGDTITLANFNAGLLGDDDFVFV